MGQLYLEMQKSFDIDEFNMDSLKLLDFDSVFYHDPQKEFRKKSIISDSVLEDMIIDESESRKLKKIDKRLNVSGTTKSRFINNYIIKGPAWARSFPDKADPSDSVRIEPSKPDAIRKSSKAF